MNILLYTSNNCSVVVQIFVCQFCYRLKIISRNTLPEPQPDSASYDFLDLSLQNISKDYTKITKW